MSPEQDFYRILSDLHMPMARYIASIERKREAFGWDDDAMQLLEREREMLEGNYRPLARYALAETLHDVPEGSIVVDWGIGDGYSHPLDRSLDHLRIVGIDPQVQAFQRGVALGRISPSVTLIDRDSPPYDELGVGSVGAVFAVSAFHILNETRLIEVVSDLHSRLASDGQICLLQDMVPGPDFLLGVSETRLERMTQYFMQKYGYNVLKPGSIKNRGGFWGDYHERVVNDVAQTQGVHFSVDRTGELYAIEATSMPFFPDVSVWDNMNGILAALAKQRSRYTTSIRSVGEIEQYLKPQGHPELYRIILATNRLTRLVSDVAQGILEDKNLRGWSIALMQVVAALSQDIYEAHLMTVFEDMGLTAIADRMGVVTQYKKAPEGRGTISYLIDGSATASPEHSGRAEIVATIRRVRVW